MQIVADHQDRHIAFPVQLLQKPQNLRLNGHIQRRSGLVGQKNFWVADNGRRDHHALQHTAGQLVGKFVVHRFRVVQLHAIHDLQRDAPALLFGHIGVDTQRLLHLRANAHDGVHGGHGFLEHHAQLFTQNVQNLGIGTLEDLAAVQSDAAFLLRLSAGQQTADAHGGDGLSASAFSHQTDDLTLRNGKGDVIHGETVGGGIVEMHTQILYL